MSITKISHRWALGRTLTLGPGESPRAFVLLDERDPTRATVDGDRITLTFANQGWRRLLWCPRRITILQHEDLASTLRFLITITDTEQWGDLEALMNTPYWSPWTTAAIGLEARNGHLPATAYAAGDTSDEMIAQYLQEARHEATWASKNTD